MNGRYTYEKAAITILKWLHMAEGDLLGHDVVTFNGETGVILELRLDDTHGLCFTFDPHDMIGARRFYPVSTIKMYGPKHVTS